MNGFKRVFRYSACVAIAIGSAEACSSNDSTTLIAPSGPPTLAISGVSLGDASDASRLGCDYTIGVTLQVGDWTLRPPGVCAEPQCGQLRVSLLDGPDGARLLTQVSASTGVALSLAKLRDAGTLQPGTYAVEAELIDDAGKPFVVTDGGNSSAQLTFPLVLPSDCSATSGTAGASGSANGEGGASGSTSGAGAAGTPDGVAGEAAGGSSGAPAAAGSAGI